MSQVPYILTNAGSGVKVGVSIAAAPPGADQPVVVNADIANWLSSKSIIGGGPVRLGVGSYQFTAERDGLVIATDNADASRDWFIFPADEPDTYRIAVDPAGMLIWTAFKEGPIMITLFSPGSDASIYQFKFTPLLK